MKAFACLNEIAVNKLKVIMMSEKQALLLKVMIAILNLLTVIIMKFF